MQKYKFSTIIDLTITVIFFFLLFFCWIRFYTKNLTLSIIGAICACFIVVFLLYFIKNKKNNKKSLNTKQKNLALDCSVQLMFTPQNKVQEYFEKLLKNKYKTMKINGGIKLTSDTFNAFFFPAYTVEKLLTEHLSQIIALSPKPCNQIFIATNNAENSTLDLAKSIKNISITIYNSFQTYEKIISKSNILPEKVIVTEILKPTHKQLLQYAFSKQRSKNYLLFGFILILSSFFVAFKIYYLIFGTALILTGIIVRFLPYKKQETKVEIL